MFLLDEIYANKNPSRPVDPEVSGTSDGRRSRSSNRPGSRDGASGRSRNVSISSSSEQQDHSSPGKRSSIFSIRPKSAMTNQSNDGSVRAQTPIAAGGIVHSKRSSVATERPMSPTDGDGLRQRMPFGRSGKKFRASVRSPSPMDADDEGEPRRRDKYRQRRGSSVEPPHPHLGRISAPFGFQHIASIEKEGLPNTLKKTPPQPLRPPPEEMLTSLAMRSNALRKGPPPLRPKRSDELLVDMMLSAPPPIQELRQIRSAESFEQASRGPMLPPIGSIPPLFPPSRRASGRLASTRALIGSAADYITMPELYGRPQTARDLTLSGEWDRLLPLYDTKQSSMYRDPTTPPQVRPPPIPEPKPAPPSSTPFSAPLELVPEEPEGTLSARQSVEVRRLSLLQQATVSPRLPCFDSMSRGESKPEPSLREGRPSSQVSDTLGGSSSTHSVVEALETPTIAIPGPRKVTPRALTDIDSSWEEDIDYCYEHEAESHCDFDWNDMSILNDATSDDELDDDEDEPLPWERKKRRPKDQESGTVDSLSTGEGENLQPGKAFYHMPFNLPEDAVPELDRQSAHTGSTNSFSASTPSDRHASTPDVEVSVQIHNSSPLALTPQLPPLDIKAPLSSEQMYHNLLSGNDLQTEARPAPLEIPAKSRLRQNSVKQNHPAAPTSAPAPELVEEHSIPAIPLAAASTPELSLKKATKLTLNSMVAALRGHPDSPSSPSTPTEERKFSRPSTPSRSRFRSRSRSRSRARKASDTPTEPIPPTPTLSKAISMENLLAPIAVRANKPLTPPETPATATNSPVRFDIAETMPKLPGSNIHAWSSTPALVSPGYVTLPTRNDSPPATPALPKGLGIDTRSSLVPHSLFVREPKSPPAPPSPQLPEKHEGRAKRGIPPSLEFVDFSESEYAGSTVEVLATPATPSTPRGNGKQSYHLFPAPGTPTTPRGRSIIPA